MKAKYKALVPRTQSKTLAKDWKAIPSIDSIFMNWKTVYFSPCSQNKDFRSEASFMAELEEFIVQGSRAAIATDAE